MGKDTGSRILTLPPANSAGLCWDQWYEYVVDRGILPADPVIFWALMSAGAGVPGKMNSSPAGISLNDSTGTPRFFARTDFCIDINDDLLVGTAATYRIVRKDFRGKKRIVLGEVPVVKNKHELDTVGKSLDAMWDTAWSS
jgi:hypothetical protein